MIEEQVTSTVQEGNSTPSEATAASLGSEVDRSGDEGAAPSIGGEGEDQPIEAVSDDVEIESSEPSTEESESDEDVDESLEDQSQESESDEAQNKDEAPIDEQKNHSQSSSKESSPDSKSKSDDDEDERCELEKQPYKFEQCTVQIAVQLLPDNGREGGRRVIVGVRSHLDAPIVRATSLNELGSLPPVVIELLDELKGEMPKRDLHAREAFEQKRLSKIKRKAQLAASPARATDRANKAAKRKSLSDAPVATTPVVDNRPRPDVKVPTSTQRQIGLF